MKRKWRSFFADKYLLASIKIMNFFNSKLDWGIHYTTYSHNLGRLKRGDQHCTFENIANKDEKKKTRSVYKRNTTLHQLILRSVCLSLRAYTSVSLSVHPYVGTYQVPKFWMKNQYLSYSTLA